jgi:hypothetical protein
MTYLSVIDDSLYLLWQQEVQIQNFRKLGLLEQLTVVVLHTGEQPSSYAQDVSKLCRTYFFKNEQADQHYPASNKPYGVARLLENQPEYSTRGFVLMDSDMILTAPLELNRIREQGGMYFALNGDPMNTGFISQKLPELDQALGVIGVSRENLLHYDHIVGSIPLWVQGISSEFVHKIARDAVALHLEFERQAALGATMEVWTAEMYAWNWNLYAVGAAVNNAPELDSMWAWEPLSSVRDRKIIHAAGVSKPESGHFCKLLYHDASPLEYRDFAYVTRQDCCSWLYYQAVLETQTVRQERKIFFERARGMADFGSGTKTKKPF